MEMDEKERKRKKTIIKKKKMGLGSDWPKCRWTTKEKTKKKKTKKNHRLGFSLVETERESNRQ